MHKSHYLKTGQMISLLTKEHDFDDILFKNIDIFDK